MDKVKYILASGEEPQGSADLCTCNVCVIILFSLNQMWHLDLNSNPDLNFFTDQVSFILGPHLINRQLERQKHVSWKQPVWHWVIRYQQKWPKCHMWVLSRYSNICGKPILYCECYKVQLFNPHTVSVSENWKCNWCSPRSCCSHLSVPSVEHAASIHFFLPLLLNSFLLLFNWSPGLSVG